MDRLDELLTRGVANIISNKAELKKTLESGKTLNVYIGIDPTATKIHLGHAVPLRKLQSLAELGHNVTFLIGDFTALIGDTSDKNTERPVLTSEQIEENFQTYKQQAEKILDFSKIKVRRNSEWLKPLMFEDIVKLAQHFSVGDFVGRELIRRRLQENKRVALHEVLYPVMQGYDSYFMDTDIQIGGTDQTFNMQAGRTLQKDLRGKESFVLATEFLIGTDGQKMSKSLGNAIWLDETPNDMYAKVMAVNDNLIVEYYKLATNVPLEKVDEVKAQLEKGEHPMDIKHELATTIVTELHSKTDAEKAREHFTKNVQQKDMSETIQELPISEGTIINEALLVQLGVAKSLSEAKRLFEQGGVSVNNEKVQVDEKTVSKGQTLKIGKKNVYKIISE